MGKHQHDTNAFVHLLLFLVIPIIFHFLWCGFFFFILLLRRVNQLWIVLLCEQRGLLKNLSGAKHSR